MQPGDSESMSEYEADEESRSLEGTDEDDTEEAKDLDLTALVDMTGDEGTLGLL